MLMHQYLYCATKAEVMAVVTSTVNSEGEIGILDTLIISDNRSFCDAEVIFQDDNASSHRAKSV